MTATAILGLKQQLTTLSETERRQLSVFLIRLGQESGEWKKETARRLADMESGRQTSVTALRRRLGHSR